MNYENYDIYLVEGEKELEMCRAFKDCVVACRTNRTKWVKKHGGKHLVMQGRQPIGLMVKEETPIDADCWKLANRKKMYFHGFDTWIPNSRSKAGKEIRRQLAELKEESSAALAQSLGAYRSALRPEGGSIHFCESSVGEIGTNWILVVPKSDEKTDATPIEIAGLRCLKLSEFYALKEATGGVE